MGNGAPAGGDGGRPGLGRPYLSISAIFNGPDLTATEDQAETLFESLTLDPEPTASSS